MSIDEAKAMATRRHCLERHLHPELDLPVAVLPNGARSIRRAVDEQVLRWIVGTEGIAIRKVEVGMVERIQHLRVNVHSYVLRDRNDLDDRDIRVEQSGPLQENTATQLAWRGGRLDGPARTQQALREDRDGNVRVSSGVNSYLALQLRRCNSVQRNS